MCVVFLVIRCHIISVVKKALSYEPVHDFKQCGILTSVDSVDSLQPPMKLRHSKWCSVSSLVIIEYSSGKQWL